MSNLKIILVHSAIPANWLKRPGKGVSWLFLGRSYSERLKWEKALGREWKINYKQELTAASYALRDEFIKWSADLGRPYWKRWYWWIGRFASRNNLTSKFYLDLCYLEVLKTVLAQQKGPVIVIAESRELLKTIFRYWKDKSVLVRPFSFMHLVLAFSSLGSENLKFFLAWAKFFKKSLREQLAARFSAFTCGFGSSRMFEDGRVIIHTCVDDACLGSDGEFRDRYYPFLADFLREKGKKVSTLIWLYNVKKMGLVEVFRWFRKNRNSFLIPQDYYNLLDCLYAFMILFKSSRLKFAQDKCYFRGVNISALIKAEQFIQSRDSGSAYFVNQIALFRRWKKLNYRFDYYVDTWELRNCETAAIFGIRANYPACRIVAYEHIALIPKLLFFNYKTTPEEFNASWHPDIGIANCRINKEFLLREGFSEPFVKVGPALRYLWLKKYADRNLSLDKTSGVLVCLPLSADVTLSLLETVYQAFSGQPDMEIKIKIHPMMNFAGLKKKLSFCWPDNFLIVEGGMEEWLKSVKVAVVSQGGAMVDAVYLGVPTVIVGQETDIDIVPLDMLDSLSWGQNDKNWKVAYNCADLQQAVKYFYGLTRPEKPGRIKDFFEFEMSLLDKVFTN